MSVFTFNDNLVLTKVISGGQVGADQAGLEAAALVGLETGGTAPLNYRTQDGPNLRLRDEYGLAEDPSYNYKPRTIKNVMDSDGTLIIAKNLHSPGCLLTSRTALGRKKPVLAIKVPADRYPTEQEIAAWTTKVRDFLCAYNIFTLNVAGNRDHLLKEGEPSLFDMVCEILVPVFEEAYAQDQT